MSRVEMRVSAGSRMTTVSPQDTCEVVGEGLKFNSSDHSSLSCWSICTVIFRRVTHRILMTYRRQSPAPLREGSYFTIHFTAMV